MTKAGCFPIGGWSGTRGKYADPPAQFPTPEASTRNGFSEWDVMGNGRIYKLLVPVPFDEANITLNGSRVRDFRYQIPHY